jgi:hypothetical protein
MADTAVSAVREERTFAKTVGHVELGSLTLAQVTAGMQVGRTSYLVRSADPRGYGLGLQIAGTTVLRQDGREAVLMPGDLAFYDAKRPYELQFDAPFRMIVLVLARGVLRASESSLRDMACRRIAGDVGLGALVGPFVAGLVSQAGRRGTRPARRSRRRVRNSSERCARPSPGRAAPAGQGLHRRPARRPRPRPHRDRRGPPHLTALSAETIRR